MRWFIEVSSGNPTGPAEQWVVEASQWQPALQAARALRSEPVETTEFSIELLEDGFRVIDPATLVRYVIRRAPDATPLSTANPTRSAAAHVASNGGSPNELHATSGESKPALASGTNGDSPIGTVPNREASSPARTPSTAPRALGTQDSKPPSASPPATDMAGMTQAERIAAMLSVDPTTHSSRAPRGPSNAPNSSAPKTAPRSIPAANRNGGQPSRPPRSTDATPSKPGVALRAPQGAALRAPRVAAVVVPEPPPAISQPVPSAVPEPPAAEVPAIEPEPPAPVQVAQSVPTAPVLPEASVPAPQPPPPRTIMQPLAAPVVQSLSELQTLVRPSAPPRPVSQPPPAPVVDTSQPPATVRSSPPPVADALVSPSVHPSPSSPPEPLPIADLLFQRSEDPSASSPLTYREAAWAVPEGTSIAAAVRLLAGMFEGVRAALAGVKPGKLVYMAIFDHRFVGKPTRPPLATLTWKDWKDQGQGPEIRRQGEPRTSFQPPTVSNSFIPAAVPQPPGAMQAQAPIASAAAAPGPAAVAAPTAAATSPAVDVPSVIIAPVAAHVAPAAVPVPSPPAAVPLPPSAAAAPPPAPPVAVAPAPYVAAPATAEAPPAPKLVIVPEPVTPLPIIAPSAAPRAPAPSAPSVRLSGVELIADLFECMHDLHFLADPLTGADFVLGLMLDKLPSAVALVHFYDIDAREFVVVRAAGAGAAKVMQIRTNEKEPLIAEAMHKGRAVVVDDASVDSRAQNGRWALIGDPPRSIICAPVEQGGRFLGLLELSNPLDGQPFREGDGHAITYIGEQFAEFLAARGVVLDPERIGD